MANNNPGMSDKVYSKYFLRQLFICSGAWASNFVFGLAFGAPTVLIPQVRREANSTAAVTEEMTTWLAFSSNLTGIIWVFVLPYLSTRLGRKISFLIVALNSVIGFTIIYCSNSVLQIIIGLLLLGAARTSMNTISPMIITEYTSPRFRSLMLTIMAVSFFWGVWVANATGTFTHWKIIGIIGIVCSVYSLTAIMWPESPYWLAARGRTEKCTAAHRWLNRCNENHSEDLKSLIATQAQGKDNVKTGLLKEHTFTRKLIIALKDRPFYEPLIINILFIILLVFSGKLINTMYALDVLKKITNSTSASYTGMLILDGLTVFSAYVGCVFSKLVSSKKFFFTSSLITILFMLVISLYLYLIKLSIVSENLTCSLILLSGYSVSFSSGPMIFGQSISFEVMPFRYKNSLLLISTLCVEVVVTILLKLSPLLVRLLDMHGMFLMYSLTSMFALGFLFRLVPETKDKSLQEIEQSFMNNMPN